MSDYKIETVPTEPYNDQKPGTSGLRKKVTVFQKPNYLANFVQSIFNALPADELKGSTLVVSGDGRYYNKEATHIIFQIAAANGVSKIIVGQNYLMSTPCVSAVIRGHKAYGGIILTASHNPGGPTQDFGIKYNASNGGPAPEKMTDAMYQISKNIREYKIIRMDLNFDPNVVGVYQLGPLTVQVIDATEEYSRLLRSIFDFDSIKKLVSRSDFKFVYDAMNGVAGPFARRIFCTELGASESVLINAVPKEDFDGGHPDPNLTYARDLVQIMGLPVVAAPHDDHHHSSSHSRVHEFKEAPDFGAAGDGDADRNMILGKRFFVTPSDSVAIIAAYAKEAIPYFRNGLKGVSRSMPTSQALDRVAEKIGVKCYEVPTGWKFFGNLMDGEMLSICGEESFGTGSDHIREKDGLWAVLAWLSILAHVNKDTPVGSLVPVKDIVEKHWQTYGRNYYSRYDYENVASEGANRLMADLIERINSNTLTLPADCGFTLARADEFSYTDPVDKSVSAHQGIRILFSDGSRVVYRLSGTGSEGATVRVYLEKYQNDPNQLAQDAQDALGGLIKLALSISKLTQYTGRDSPTVIT